jgi:enoyl-CoA hydratase/carnithine racemase
MTCDLVRNMRRMPQPIIAAVNGVAAGAGAVIALASDLRIVAEGASFHFLFTKVALTGADMGTAWLLPRVIGEGRAKEVLLFGEGISARQALDWGLASRVVPEAQVMEAALGWARTLADAPQEAIRLTKRAIHAEAEISLAAALELEASAQATLLRSTDHHAFLDSLRK